MPVGDPDAPKVVSIRVEPAERDDGHARRRSNSAWWPQFTDGRETDVTEHARFQVEQRGPRVRHGRRPRDDRRRARRGRRDGRVHGRSRRLPGHRAAARQAGAGRPPQGVQLRRRTRGQEARQAEPRAVRSMRRRRIPPPRHARLGRLAADARRKSARSSPTRPPTSEAEDRRVAQAAGVRRPVRRCSGPTCCASTGRRSATSGPTPTTAGCATRSRPNKPFDQFARELLTAEGPLSEVRPGQLLQGRDEARRDGRHAVAGVPRRPHRLRRVPPPPVRPLEPDRLRRHGGVLRPGGRPRGRPRRGRLQSAATPSRSTREPTQSSPPTASERRHRRPTPRRPPGRAGRLDDRCRRTRSSPGTWPTASGRTCSAGASSSRWTTCGRPTRRATPNCSTPSRRSPSTRSTTCANWSASSACRGLTRRRRGRTTTNEKDEQNFSRMAFKRPDAEVLLDMVGQATGVPDRFPGMPAGTKAVQLWDSRARHDFLKLFGRPSRTTACDCERNREPSTGQVLNLLNSPEIQAKLAHEAGTVAKLVRAHGRRREAGRGTVPDLLRPLPDRRRANRAGRLPAREESRPPEGGRGPAPGHC